MITREEAKEILAAFGPGSVLYETSTPSEVVEEVGTFTPRGYIESQLVIEAISNDRMENAACEQEASGEEQYKGRHFQVVSEDVELLLGMKERTKALMARKEW